MRARCLVFLGLVAALLATAEGLTQPPSGGFPSRGGKGGRGGDPNQIFDFMSGGKDVITRAEMDAQRGPGSFDRMAQRMGFNGDRITRADYVNSMQQRMSGMGGGPGGFPGGRSGGFGPPSGGYGPQGGGPGGGPPRDYGAMAEDRFRRYDINGDGMLNNDELPDYLRPEREKVDTNGNGLIELSEFKVYYEARMQQRNADRGQNGSGDPSGLLPFMPNQHGDDDDQPKPTVYRAGKLPPNIPAWFKEMDGDNDGQIGLYEWKNGSRELSEFKQIDRNGDGFLTIAEVMRYSEATLAKNDMGTGGPGFGSSGFGGGGSRGFGPGGGGMGGFGGPGGGPGRMRGGPPGGDWGGGGGKGGDFGGGRGKGGKGGRGKKGGGDYGSSYPRN
jgi:hypothetical protein